MQMVKAVQNILCAGMQIFFPDFVQIICQTPLAIFHEKYKLLVLIPYHDFIGSCDAGVVNLATEKRLVKHKIYSVRQDWDNFDRYLLSPIVDCSKYKPIVDIFPN